VGQGIDAASQSEWTTYTVLQLVLPAVAIIISALIAYLGWRQTSRLSQKGWERALDTANQAQITAARLARERQAHDQLVSILGRYIEWLSSARGLLSVVAGTWRVKANEKPQRKLQGYEIEFDQSQAAELKASLEAVNRDASWISDATLCFPMDANVVYQLEVLGFVLRAYWDDVERDLKLVGYSGLPGHSDVRQLEEGHLYLRCIREFCEDLRVMVQNRLLELEYEGLPPGAKRRESTGKWLKVDDGIWVLLRPMPYLNRFHMADEAEKMRVEFADELKRHPIFD
jgi:hypothetical protein